MHRLDRGDDRDLRPHQPREWLDLAGMVHAQLEHGVACALWTARQRQRHAPMVVVGRKRGMGLAVAGKRQTQPLLGARLADRAGDADDFRSRARARRPREVAQALEHVGNDEQRRILGKALAPVGGDDRKPGACRERGRNEVAAVAVVAFDGEDCFAGRTRARVDGNARHRRRQRPVARGAHRSNHRLDGPERPIGHATLPASAAATASWSLNGSTCLPMIWPVSWPLPAISSTSPWRKSAIEAWIASRRSPISSAPGEACRIAARIAAGLSLRGLSSVTTTRSASCAAIAPIIGPLPWPRRPPQPNTTTRGPLT